MKILFDQGTPVPLRKHLASHHVRTAFEQGWSQFQNGALLAAAEQDGYEVLITTDRNLKYQQNLVTRRIAIVVLLSTSWPRMQGKLAEIQSVVADLTAGDYVEVSI